MNNRQVVGPVFPCSQAWATSLESLPPGSALLCFAGEVQGQLSLLLQVIRAKGKGEELLPEIPLHRREEAGLALPSSHPQAGSPATLTYRVSSTKLLWGGGTRAALLKTGTAFLLSRSQGQVFCLSKVAWGGTEGGRVSLHATHRDEQQGPLSLGPAHLQLSQPELAPLFFSGNVWGPLSRTLQLARSRIHSPSRMPQGQLSHIFR